MNIYIAFAVFIICIAAAIIFDISHILPLAAGFFIFSFLALKKGFGIKDILRFSLDSLHDSSIVILVMLLIGCLTGLWRLNGTIAYFVSAGVKLMPPSVFVLAAFLICAAMSYAIGSSFGVTATAGVIVMSIARAGNLPATIVAGAIISGVYVGDRGSPASSAANLVAALTGTDIRKNIRIMFKTALIPFILTCVLYTLLSLRYPMNSGESELLDMLAVEFNLSRICLIPAILMIVLPFFNVNIKISLVVDIIVSIIIAITVQQADAAQCLKAAVLGYSTDNAMLSSIISGGGLKSMLEVSIILLISGTYGKIFQGTGLLLPITDAIKTMSSSVGRFLSMIILSFAVCMIFCNQTIGSIMINQLSSGIYGDSEEEKYNKMTDIECSTITIAAMVPWCIAVSVPLAMLDADMTAIPFAFFVFLVPICHLIRSRRVKNGNT